MTTPRIASFIGQVVKRSDYWDSVRVRVIKMKMDNYLCMYFNKQSHYWAAEPDNMCKDGDIVLIKTLEEPQSDRVKFYVKKVVFDVGNVIDPITGRRCRGTEFADSVDLRETIRRIPVKKYRLPGAPIPEEERR